MKLPHFLWQKEISKRNCHNFLAAENFLLGIFKTIKKQDGDVLLFYYNSCISSLVQSQTFYRKVRRLCLYFEFDKKL
ncbi:hypothetical protein NAT51_18750 [Flavobacterium amniphilum]|uniref:hypothetical protein n=1 Tax=Flavobacterium amniphilum TaxID=1834035 RepID=UPI00202A062E|nr:hypothetical protein [Flavobacterium amniphilum]MCL9807569.1 hypothetical protein [Flavobacterium amniphilum]